MFCYQCQETAKGTGCTIQGVCGKTNDVANLQDLLMFTLKGVSIFTKSARDNGVNYDEKINKFVFDGLFATITNANFSKKVFVERVKNALEIRNELRSKLEAAGVKFNDSELHESATWNGTPDTFETKALTVGVLATENEDVRSLRELITYGLKGLAAYTEHAYNLDHENKELYKFMQDALVATTDDTMTADQLVALTLETGKYGVDAMALLDAANTTAYGNPEITKVNIGVSDKPGILISGHDLKDMEELLKQTEGTGVDVYTHSEMLPANYYPAFKKYSHFIGNYGNAWWKQKE